MVDETSVLERLARIETNQQNQVDQLNRVLTLLDRMVRVEERQNDINSRSQKLESTLKSIQEELSSWKTARNVFVWAAGIVGSVITAWIIFFTGKAS